MNHVARAVLAMVGLVLSLGPAVPTTAQAQEEEDQERVTGQRPPPIDLDAIQSPRPAHMKYEINKEMTREEYQARPYPPQTYFGAQALQLDPDFVYAVQQGLEKIYLREYPEAREYFVKVEEKYPGTGVAAVADLLVWQALMLENFDFRFDKQYWVSSKAARRDLEAALAKPGNEGWENFLMAGVVGIEAIHTMRQTKYLAALQLAFNAMDHIEASRKASPEFVDITLADGMYNYWRSVVTMSSKVLPDFGDKRVEGIQQMKTVETGGVFLASPATLSLAFTWLEEGKLKMALDSCSKNRRKYPKNVVNNLVTGTTYIYLKNWKSAFKALNAILEEDPNNKRVRYWLGLAHLRSGDVPAAEKEFTTYLATDHLEDWQRANAQYRMGQVYTRQKKHAEAYASYKAAVQTNNHKNAKRAVERMKKRKKAGKIKF